MVERHADMRDAGSREQGIQAAQQTQGCANLPAVGRLTRGCAEVVAKELVGAIDEVNVHGLVRPILYAPAWGCKPGPGPRRGCALTLNSAKCIVRDSCRHLIRYGGGLLEGWLWTQASVWRSRGTSRILVEETLWPQMNSCTFRALTWRRWASRLVPSSACSSRHSSKRGRARWRCLQSLASILCRMHSSMPCLRIF